MHQQVCKDFLPKLAEALKGKDDVCYKAGARFQANYVIYYMHYICFLVI